MAEKLHLETLEAGTLELLKRLTADKQLRTFNLVGGAALALQLGHRKSVDLDLFTTGRFDTERMAAYLEKQYKAEIFDQNDKGVFGYIGPVKVDLMREPHPLIDTPEKREGLRMLSIRDIGAMKMYAVHNGGGRLKDFADIHKLLERDSLGTYLDYTRQKYPEVIPLNLKRLLVDQPNTDLDDKVNPGRIFGEVQQLKNDQRIAKTPRHRRGQRPG
jgi:Nucleotidyl transferase AbiEii toxin, Type IV TA system